MSVQTDENRIKEIKTLAGNVLELARDEILMSFRFLDRSLMELKTEMRPGIEGVSSSDSVMYYDPVYILKASQKDFRYPARILFHVLLHHIFAHPFTGERTDAVLWDLACDIAVESVIADLHEPCITLDADLGTAGMLRVLREDIGPLSAEKVYKYFRKNPLTPSRVLEYERAFKKDEHDLWHSSSEGEIVISEEEWKKIARQVLAEIRNFSEKGTAAESRSGSSYGIHSIF